MRLHSMLNDALATANNEMALAEAQARMWRSVVTAVQVVNECVNPERAGIAARHALDAEQYALNGHRTEADNSAQLAIEYGLNQ